MEDILKALFIKDLIELLQTFGLPEGVAKAVLTTLFGAIIGFIGKQLKNWYTKIKNSKAAKDLHPFFSEIEVRNATQFYIETKCQDIPPTKENEPGRTHAFARKEKLIRFFLKKGFNTKKDDERFYIILADSGMGKTTFMINLYLRYNGVFNFSKKHKIRLLSFNHLKLTEKLKEISKEAYDTILLLDAFDEDTEAVKDYEKRLNDIIDLVQDFREVIITCRTQFFPTQEAEPHEILVTKNTEGGGYHVFRKMYVSPFDEKDIASYLRKKYGILKIWNRRRKMKAKAIVQKSPNLMVRPMLLSYVDDLLKEKILYKFSFQIYAAMVKRWIAREAKRKLLETREKFTENLNRFSQAIAIELYKRRKENNNSLQMKRDEVQKFAKDFGIELETFEITGRSLLTRNAVRDWKFAHKSILEYFLAKEAIENVDFEAELDFKGMEACEAFYKEMILEKYTLPFFELNNIKGKYATLSNPKLRSIPKKLSRKEIENIKELNADIQNPLVVVPLINIEFDWESKGIDFINNADFINADRCYRQLLQRNPNDIKIKTIINFLRLSNPKHASIAIKNLRELVKQELPGIFLLNLIVEKSKYKNEDTFNIANSVNKRINPNTDFTDNRDGHIYKTVIIGSQIWMAENLAYIPHVSPLKKHGGIWVYGYDGEDVNEAKATSNYKKYGCLYDWKTATSKDICPKGWHLPTDDEWKKLGDYLGGDEIAGKKLKATSFGGNNESGFNALPGGLRDYDGSDFDYEGAGVDFWSATPKGTESAWGRYLYSGHDRVIRFDWGRTDGHSIRCLKDN